MWSGEKYDFHGGCDLVLLHDDSFAHGLGITIHIRTKERYGYSYIETAAVRIGEDTLEVSSYGFYMVNGVSEG